MIGEHALSMFFTQLGVDETPLSFISIHLSVNRFCDPIYNLYSSVLLAINHPVLCSISPFSSNWQLHHGSTAYHSYHDGAGVVLGYLIFNSLSMEQFGNLFS